MSAFTSDLCYRSYSDPPIVTTTDLAHFTERILALDILENDSINIQLKFGRAIDQDDRGTHVLEETSNPNIAVMADYAWDISEYRQTSAQARALFRQPPTERTVVRKRKHLLNFFGPESKVEKLGPNVYRASLGFGMLKEQVYLPLVHDLDNNFLHLTNLSFHINVIELNDPEEATICQVGWMAFSISGYGYLFPWTYEETYAKLCAHPALAAVRAICREMWPASAESVLPKKLLAVRRRMGKLWQEPLNAPHDWYWAINETY